MQQMKEPLLASSENDEFDENKIIEKKEDSSSEGFNKEKCKHIGQSLEDPLSKFLGASISLMMTFKNAIVGFIPLLTIYPTFKINYELYTKRAASRAGSEILPVHKRPQHKTNLAQDFKTQVGYSLLWLASAQGGFVYGWGMVQVMAPHQSYIMKALIGYSAAMLQHAYHMGAEVELNYKIMEYNGSPAYRNNIGKYLDFSRSLLLIPPAVSPWLHQKTNLNHFCIKMAPLYRSGVHIAAIFTALTKVFRLPSLLAAPLAALFGPFEGDYIAAYNQKIAEVTLDLKETKPEGVSRILLGLFDNPMSRVFFNLLTLKPITRLLAVFIDPMLLCKLSKVLGSGGMGTGSGAEIREKLPELVFIFSQLFGDPVEFFIPDEVSLNFKEEPAKFVYLMMLVFMTVILLWNGLTQFLSARKSTLDGVEIGMDQQVQAHFYGGAEPQNSYFERIKQRGKVAFNDLMDNVTLTLWSQPNRHEYMKKNFTELMEGLSCGLWSESQSKINVEQESESNQLDTLTLTVNT